MKKRTSTTNKTGGTRAGAASRPKRADTSRSKGGAKSSGRSATKSRPKEETTASRSKSKTASGRARSTGTRSSGTRSVKSKRTASKVKKGKTSKAKTTSRKTVGKPATADTTKVRTTDTKAPSTAGRPAATSQDPIQFPEQRRRKVKTHLSTKELREFKELLLHKRAELAGDVRRLTSEALNRQKHGESDHSSMPIHMADRGSDTWEQDFTLGLIANEEALAREIDEALARIEKRTYGVCVATQNKISRARLLAKPWAKYCIEYARAREEGRAP